MHKLQRRPHSMVRLPNGKLVLNYALHHTRRADNGGILVEQVVAQVAVHRVWVVSDPRRKRNPDAPIAFYALIDPPPDVYGNDPTRVLVRIAPTRKTTIVDGKRKLVPIITDVIAFREGDGRDERGVETSITDDAHYCCGYGRYERARRIQPLLVEMEVP